MLNIGMQTESEMRPFATDPVEKDGAYVLQVVSAWESRAVNPGDIDDPTRKRSVNLRVEIVEVRPTWQPKFQETPEEMAARRDQIGKYADISIFLDKRSDHRALEGRLGLLCNIAGTSQAEFQKALDAQGLLKKAYTGTEKGEDRYDIGLIADEVHINATSFLGRTFIGQVEIKEGDTRTFYDVRPWQHYALSQEHQLSFKGKTPAPANAFEGEDTASAEKKAFFEKLRADKAAKGENGSASRSSAQGARRPASQQLAVADVADESFEFGPDDDLPF